MTLMTVNTKFTRRFCKNVYMIVYEVDSFFSIGGKIDSNHKKLIRMFKIDIGMTPAGKKGINSLQI